MSAYYTKLELPLIPFELREPYESIISRENLFPDKSYTPYTTHPLSKELQLWFDDLSATHLGYDCQACYQIVHEDLPKHTDVCVNDTKLNFIMDQGGSAVYTNWWDGQHGAQLDSTIFETECWYEFNIRTWHNVVGIERPRVSIVVMENL